MNTATSVFEPATEYLTPQPETPQASRFAKPLMLAAGIALVLVAFVLMYSTLGGSADATPEPRLATRVTATPTVEPVVETEPVEAAPAAPSAPSGGNSSPPPAPAPAPEPEPEPAPEPEPEPEPTPQIHPLDGTLWNVTVLSDGVGGMYDIHPSYPHQVEFEDGRVYSKGWLNSGNAEYSISGDEWGWGPDFNCGPIMTTMMAGPAEAMTQEAWINTGLESAAYYEVFEHTLFIRNGSGDDLLILDIVPGG